MSLLRTRDGQARTGSVLRYEPACPAYATVLSHQALSGPTAIGRLAQRDFGPVTNAQPQRTWYGEVMKDPGVTADDARHEAGRRRA